MFDDLHQGGRFLTTDSQQNSMYVVIEQITPPWIVYHHPFHHENQKMKKTFSALLQETNTPTALQPSTKECLTKLLKTPKYRNAYGYLRTFREFYANNTTAPRTKAMTPPKESLDAEELPGSDVAVGPV